ncbi:uncharacterized protein TNCT_521431 [Trichonephila clavata]|uniref:Uncharacterized protein n=1 Tax=Trichonephila clavata TaxID=2740835 RepID=A0A8X6F205_TRICU|nr:uncharacterized protein TNCT_521431 [Trichonephila clavata]
MTQANEEPLTYLELYSKCKASTNISRKQPPTHPWYLSQCPGASMSFEGDRTDQTTFARLSMGNLKSLRFFHTAKTFPICSQCNDAEATQQHLPDCVDLELGQKESPSPMEGQQTQCQQEEGRQEIQLGISVKEYTVLEQPQGISGNGKILV